MKLVWHIVRKDLRRMRVPLALWALVLAGKNEMGVDLLHGDAADLVHLDLMRMSIAVFVGVDVFVNLILVGLLVQEDALVGTNSFWFTRPISGGRLLAAKLLGSFLMFGVLPILVSLRWWIACGYGVAEMFRGALLVLDTQALIVGAGLVVATLSGTINRFLLGLLGAAVACYVWWFKLVWVMADPWTNGGAQQTRIAALGALTLIAGIAVIGQRFLVRHARRAFLTLSLAGIAATFVGLWWRWDWTFRWPKAERELTAIFVSVTDAQSIAMRSPASLYVDYRITGLAKDFGLRGRATNTWHLKAGSLVLWGDLTPVQSEWADWQVLGMPPDGFTGPLHRVPHHINPVDRERRRTSEGEVVVDSVAYVRRDEVERIQDEPAAFSAHLALDVIRPRRELEFAPRQGEITRANGWTARVAFAEWRDGLLFSRLVESRPLDASDFRSRIGVTTFFRDVAAKPAEFAYYRLNRARGKAHYFGKPNGFEVTVAGQAVRWLNLTLDSTADMEGATVAIVSYEPVGHIERDVKADQLVPKEMPQ